ncbi:MAG TPA: glycosyl hydrolase 53 family protein [Bacilli bacterium]|nr:glycosyl hydrolase 53 family protein [Bacilli bacterium]
MKHHFTYGADISSLASLEELGATFKDKDGTTKDLFVLLKDAGFTSIRLRLFVDPYSLDGEPYGGGTNDLARTLSLAKRANAHGFPVVLNFHYSDFWADPGKQIVPKAWQQMHFDELLGQINNYTLEVLQAFRAENINISHIQIGNEVTNGMLWPDGRLYETEEYVRHMAGYIDKRWAPYTNIDIKENEAGEGYFTLGCFLNAGINAARKIYPESKIIIHLDRGGDQALYQEFFTNIHPLLLDFDVIGLSYYPYWHGSFSDLTENVRYLQANYKEEIMIMETSYAYAGEDGDKPFVVTNTKTPVPDGFPPYTKDGQAAYLTMLFKKVRALEIAGLYYWEPAWIVVPGDSWATAAGRAYINESDKEDGNEWGNQALFDQTGAPLPALYAYLNYLKE